MVKNRDPISRVLTEIFRWLKDNTQEVLCLRQVCGGNTSKREYLIKTQTGKRLLEFRLKKNGSGLVCLVVAFDWTALPDTQRKAKAKREWEEWLEDKNQRGWLESGVNHDEQLKPES